MSYGYVVVGADGLSEIVDDEEVLGADLSPDAQTILQALTQVAFAMPRNNPDVANAIQNTQERMLEVAYNAVGATPPYRRKTYFHPSREYHPSQSSYRLRNLKF